MNSVAKFISLLAIVFCLLATASTRPYDAKFHFCRKYIYAPRCRGAQAKRDIAKLEPLLEDTRFLQSNYDDLGAFQNNKQWSENELNNKNRLLDTLVRKMNPRGTDYDTGTDDYPQ